MDGQEMSDSKEAAASGSGPFPKGSTADSGNRLICNEWMATDGVWCCVVLLIATDRLTDSDAAVLCVVWCGAVWGLLTWRDSPVASAIALGSGLLFAFLVEYAEYSVVCIIL